MRANIITGLYLMLIGVGVVFAALVILQGFINAVAWLGRNLGPRETSPTAEPAPGEVSPEEEAVVCAAVAAALTAPVRVHHIRLLPDESQETWSRMGRLDIMRSRGRGGRPQ
ncbi:MAG TPA: OadG family protein [Candidatus Aminicenantes bacterium]|nr:OadG family protein [Candidatus Aminicenantes bacterium]